MATSPRARRARRTRRTKARARRVRKGGTGTRASQDARGAILASMTRSAARASRDAPHVLIVGGGGTGGALAHDLTLRGIRITLVERGEFTSGTTGRHHGLLHSGARYAVNDRESA